MGILYHTKQMKNCYIDLSCQLFCSFFHFITSDVSVESSDECHPRKLTGIT